MTPEERIEDALEIMDDFVSEWEAHQEEIEQDTWWDLLNEILIKLAPERADQ